MNEIDSIAVPLMKNVSREAVGVWSNPDALYFLYRHIQIDKRGSFGERLYEHLLLNAFPRRIRLEYKDGDQGEWDIKINGYGFEVKTSSIDVNNKFQNEGFHRNANILGALFVCVTPNELYFKMVRKENIPFDSLHDRQARGTGSGYKWDLKINDVVKIETIADFGKEFKSTFPEVF